MVLNDAARELLRSSALAHLTTLNSNGGPQVTAVWVDLDGDDIVMGHAAAWQKVVNIQRDPRVALSIQSPTFTQAGAQQSLVVYGRARVEEGGAYDLLSHLSHVYMDESADSFDRSRGWMAQKFPEGPDPTAGYIVRVEPSRVGGLGPWKPGPNSSLPVAQSH